jgi:hypothetical protein
MVLVLQNIASCYAEQAANPAAYDPTNLDRKRSWWTSLNCV